MTLHDVRETKIKERSKELQIAIRANKPLIFNRGLVDLPAVQHAIESVCQTKTRQAEIRQENQRIACLSGRELDAFQKETKARVKAFAAATRQGEALAPVKVWTVNELDAALRGVQSYIRAGCKSPRKPAAA